MCLVYDCFYSTLKIETSTEYGTSTNEETKFDEKIIPIPFDNLIKRLKSLDTAFYYPLIDQTRDITANTETLKLTSTQPLSIRETDIEYQFNRLVLFSRYLSAYPYKNKDLHKECQTDIPPFYRNLIWASLLDIGCNVSESYSRIDKEQQTNADRQIEVDIPRCHQYDTLIASPEAHVKLKRVLKAWVVSNPHLTYWQGLDSLCAPFLYLNFNNEALAYACFHKFIQKYASKFFLKDNSTIITEYLHVFSQLISFHDPVLAIHFENNEFRPDLYAIPWFLTMFAHIFPIQKILHLWDTLLRGTVSFPLCIGAAILKQLRKLLLNSDFNESILLFSELPEINIEKCVTDSMIIFSNTPTSCFHLQYLYDASVSNSLDIDEIRFEQRRLELFPRISTNDLIKSSQSSQFHFILIDLRTIDEATNEPIPSTRHIPFENLDLSKMISLTTTMNFPIATDNDANVQLLNLVFQNKGSVKVVVPGARNFNQAVELGNHLVRLGLDRVCCLHNANKCLTELIRYLSRE